MVRYTDTIDTLARLVIEGAKKLGIVQEVPEIRGRDPLVEELDECPAGYEWDPARNECVVTRDRNRDLHHRYNYPPEERDRVNASVANGPPDFLGDSVLLQASMMHSSLVGWDPGYGFSPLRARTISPEKLREKKALLEERKKKDRKAWLLVKEHVTPIQWEMLEQGRVCELLSNDQRFRLLVRRDGDFTWLEGNSGEGYVIQSGRIDGGEFPLGDAIACFIEWFKIRPDELLKKWNCGNFRINPYL